MIRDITLGQYYSADSLIHRLDPRVKIAATFVYLVVIFFVRDVVGYCITAAALAAAVGISGVPPRFILRGIRPILFILGFTFVINLLVYPGTVLIGLGPVNITYEGLQMAVYIAIRLVLLIFGTSLLTYTTRPMALTDGFERILRPLGRFGLPAHEIAMMMSIALRFIPTLLEETDKIMKAQQARGADFESGRIVERVKAYIPILIPLFVNSFRIAGDLAMAMEARCYRGGEGRTSLHPMYYSRADYTAYALTAAFAVLIILQSRGLLPIPMIWEIVQ